MLRVQVLGEVCAWRGNDPVALGPASRRAMLGLLALAGGQPLPRAELVAGVWYGRPPPPSAVNVLHTHVKHLRRLLEPERPAGAEAVVVRRVGEGYALHMPACTVDVVEFRVEVAAAATLRREGRLHEAITVLERALARWQGPPLTDVPALAGHPKLVALVQERQSALGRYGDLMIAAGRAADVVAALEEEAAARPLDEVAQARLMLAYRGLGRRDRAFATYHAVRRLLADDLGVDPGPELAAVHNDLLQDAPPSLPTVEAEAAPLVIAGVPEPVTPAQLIGEVPVFAGRAAELALLDGLLDAGEQTAPVVVVSGAAGMGKTSLAVHWAHRVASQFPDGQLYVNLRGFHPTGAPMDPAEALRRFLDALGVAGGQIPADLDALAALYRSKLAGRRVLVVLDNAVDVAQVRPLLPGMRSCLAVVTSRNQLAGLVAAEGALPVSLNPLAPAEAHDLLVRRLGADRAAAEPEAVAEIVQRCAGLPLALAIFAARAVIGGGHPLQAYAKELRKAGGRLDALAVGDSGIDLREVFSWSYLALGELSARLFRLLGTHPGPDISAAAAASLAGQPLPQTRAALTELVSASLLLTPIPGRYALHDLVRAYAAELVERTESAPRRRAAGRRMLAHYVHTAHAAERLLNPARGTIELEPLPPGVTAEAFPDGQEALAWFAGEHSVLLAIVDQTVAARQDTETWQLAWTLWTHLDRQGYWADLAAASEVAIAAAGRAAGPGVQADAYRMLARAYTRIGRLEDARAQLQHALDLYRRVGDRNGQANTHLNAALVWERQSEHGKALEHAQTALDLFTEDDDRVGQGRARNAVGWYHTLLGDHAQALAHCKAALAEQEMASDRAPIWDSLGYAHHKLGHHTEAVRCFQHAVDLYGEIGDRHLEGLVLAHLAEAQQAAGALRQARASWRRALAILTELDPPAAEQARIALAGLALADQPRVSGSAVQTGDWRNG
ncbi:SARP family transcriptional regulator [Rhizocola hellebori]|uniref:SARP family transcriptional regulator n=2 Tax=Rhizocola hellebori TaxID=1392758 RepID=A0A8J3QI26_9ACTN|nr:SARP family transcriptional regulator [Rhizocola hellebori]